MALDTEKIIADLKEASILELNDLVKAIEEEFGVSAAAPVAVAGAAGADGAAEKDSFDVELTDAGSAKVKVIKAVKANGKIIYRELVEELSHEPNYDQVLKFLLKIKLILLVFEKF